MPGMSRDGLRAYGRDDRKLQMLTQMMIRVERNAQPHTAYSLAKSLDMRVSPHFRKILEELVTGSFVNKIETEHRPNKKKFLYEPNMKQIKLFYGNVWEAHRVRKKKSDKIVVNAGGKQLDMFADWRK